MKRMKYPGDEMIKQTSVKIKFGSILHLLYFKEVYDLIADIEGDVVECGVGYAHSFFKLACLAYYEDKGRKLYGFDSFEGFSEPSEEDKSPRNPQKGEWNISTINTTYNLLTEVWQVPESFIKNNVIVVKGFFDESFHKYNGENIAFLHLDCDLYKSYKTSLEYFWPKIPKGGVILFDEYKNTSERFPGAVKAIDAFLGDSIAQIQFNNQANRYYIVKQ